MLRPPARQRIRTRCAGGIRDGLEGEPIVAVAAVVSRDQLEAPGFEHVPRVRPEAASKRQDPVTDPPLHAPTREPYRAARQEECGEREIDRDREQRGLAERLLSDHER